MTQQQTVRLKEKGGKVKELGIQGQRDFILRREKRE